MNTYTNIPFRVKSVNCRLEIWKLYVIDLIKSYMRLSLLLLRENTKWQMAPVQWEGPKDPGSQD